MADFDFSHFTAAFFDEARERLSDINESLVRFESDSLDEDGLIELRRNAHTIKGSALMLGINDIGETAHLFEDAMEQLIEHPAYRTPEMVQFLFDLHDKLEQRLSDQEGEHTLPVEQMQQEFKTLLAALHEGDRLTPEDLEATQERMAMIAEKPEELVVPAEPADALVAAGPEELLIESDFQEPVIEFIEEDEEDAGVTAEAVADIKLPVAGEEIPEAMAAEEAPAIEATQATEGAPVSVTDVLHEDNFRPDVAQISMKGMQRQSSGRFLRVDAERLSGLSNQVVELTTEKARGENLERMFNALVKEMTHLQRTWQQFRHQVHDLSAEGREQAFDLLGGAMGKQLHSARHFVEELRYDRDKSAIMLDDLRDQVLGLMLRPLDSIFSTFPRAIRDIAMRYKKKVKLVVAGESVELDQGVAEELVEPLVHLLNNAIAHGIEAPDERLLRNKPQEGQVTIVASQSGNEIRIDVVDDGHGINLDQIKVVAVERGVTTQREADDMDDAEALEMIFRPGFSTHEKVDEMAGRGIGMNVVQDTLRRLTGNVRIQTEEGKGTRFVLTLPVSIAVQRALLFRIGDQRLGILSHMVEQVVSLQSQQVEKGPGNKDSLRHHKHLVPLVDLRRMFLNGGRQPISDQPLVIIAEHIEGFVGIVVDELLDEMEIVVRDLDPYLKRYQAMGLMGNTITGDGSVLMLIEPYGIKEMGRTAPDQDFQTGTVEAAGQVLSILLVEDSIIARQIEKEMLEAAGFQVDTAIDGLDGMKKLEGREYGLLITDLEMPRLDGFGLVRRVRNDKRFEDLPILIISTRESAEDRLKCMEAGADAYLVKQSLQQGSMIETINALTGSLTPQGQSSTTPLPDAPIV